MAPARRCASAHPFAKVRQVATRKQFDVEIPDGQHLGISRDTDGAYRAHLFDDETNGLVGHAELFEPEEVEVGPTTDPYTYGSDAQAPDHDEQLDELAELLGNLLALAIIGAATAAAPHIKRWWSYKVLPAFTSTGEKIKSTWNRIPRTRKAGSAAATAEFVALSDPAGNQSSNEVDAVLEGLRVKMGSAEARQRFVAALVAAAFAEEQMRLLRNARIEDVAAYSELESTLHELTPQQVGDTMNLMLKADLSLLDRETLTELGRVIDEGRTDREYVPLRGQGIRQVLRLTDGRSEPDVTGEPVSVANEM